LKPSDAPVTFVRLDEAFEDEMFEYIQELRDCDAISGNMLILLAFIVTATCLTVGMLP
jgi:hypothetical protein